MSADLRAEPLLVRLLMHAAGEARASGTPLRHFARKWLQASEPGCELVAYLQGEAGLIAAAADRLNASGDEGLREIARELGNASDRLRAMVEL